MSPASIAAFFDVDKTLLTRESGELGFKYVWKLRMISPIFLLKVALVAQLYKRNWITSEAMTRYCLTYYAGRRYATYVDGAEGYYREWLRPILSPAVLSKVEEHRRMGHRLVMLSASLDYYLRPMKDDLRFDDLLCSRLETDARGFCTGRTDGPLIIGPEKRNAALRYAKENGIDMTASYAYGDHHSDIPLMEIVGHAVAVRPTKPLRKIAAERGWTILDEI